MFCFLAEKQCFEMAFVTKIPWLILKWRFGQLVEKIRKHSYLQ